MIKTVSIDELKRIRAEEAAKLSKVNEKFDEKQEKRKLKEDIRKIKAAKLRGQLGMTSQNVDNMHKATEAAGETLKKLGGTLFKGILGAGEAVNEMYGGERDGRLRSGKRNSKSKKRGRPDKNPFGTSVWDNRPQY